MQTDALNRRLRHAKPQPLRATIEISERDLLVFEKLNRHGPLPSSYLYELTKRLGSHWPTFQHRLTTLYHGTTHDSPYLVRPPQQWASYNARYQPLIYDVAPRAARLLAAYGRYDDIERSDPFLHRFMGACVASSIHLACEETKLRYITKPEIFAHPSCPDTTRQSRNPLAVPIMGKFLIPDDLIGIEYPGAKPSYRFFAVEIDRNTESIERRSLDQNAYGKKLHAYIQLLRQNAQKTHWGLPTLLVLTITTNATHLTNMLDYLRRMNEPKLAERFLFKAKQEFGPNWRVPSVMRDLLVEPWMRVNGEPFYVDRAGA